MTETENSKDCIRTVRERATMYESLSPEDLNSWFIPYLPEEIGCILDIGAGSCRDASWLASRGHQVVATEPSSAMRKEAKRFHSDSSFTLVDDRLPDLKLSRSSVSFEFILLNAVWMFIPPKDRGRSFRKLMTLLKPRGVMALTLRDPIEAERGMYPVSVSEIEDLAKRHGAYIESSTTSDDLNGRVDVRWHQIIVRLPDDGTGALPLIRRIILLDYKSSTYKLALLRALTRVAAVSPGFAQDCGNDHVKIPLGIVALSWLQLYSPLLNANMPQSPQNTSGGYRLAFAQKPLQNLLKNQNKISSYRTGIVLHADDAIYLTQALRDAAKTIKDKPVKYLYYPDGKPIFKVNKQRIKVKDLITLDENFYSAFGEIIVPAYLWRALLRYNIWIDPALVEEWAQLILRYAKSQEKHLAEYELRTLMRPYEPERNQTEVRKRALRLINSQSIYCVWTGIKLKSDNMDIDHCLPWAAWPCDDLWNLMPSSKASNRSKSDRLPDNKIIRGAQDRIMDWWERAYFKDPHISERFLLEAKARLPSLKESGPSLDDVFFALEMQRIRLYSDHQIPEWPGPKDT
ncbi:MAG: methyltransferase domain-containing protein [Bacteroidetes bacterium]|nr:methyltransferase domain-containing protein [Bacteroidota bacterium]